MNEKRFTIDEKTNYKDYPIILDTKTGDWWVIQDTMMGTEKLVGLLNEQQATIRKLQDLCGESDGENAKLRIENKKLKAKLKEKEEDERLYANEIVELRKTNEEWLQFKDLGGDY